MKISDLTRRKEESSASNEIAPLSGTGHEAQIRRILESKAFRNTEVLKRLLEYLARHSSEDLKEYTVGVEAFGKVADYDPKVDSSVRVQAGKLRQKLDEFYRTEGGADPVIVDLPKGHFRLEFRMREAEEPSAVAPAADRRWILALAVAVAAISAAIAGWAIWARPAKSPAAGVWTPSMEEFWRPFVGSARPIVVAIGSPMFAKVGNSFFRDPGINNWEAAKDSDELRAVEKAVGVSGAAAAYPYTGAGDAAGAFALERLMLGRGRDLTLQLSAMLTWEDISRNNMIFLGPPKFTQATGGLPVAQDFEIQHGRVQNLRPAAGEPREYMETWSADHSQLEEGHALISRLPGLHQSGEMLVLAGSSTESTRAAVEYVTRPEYISEFVSWMKKTQGGVPDWFQAVVRAKYKSGTPIEIERVGFHRLN